MPRRHLLSARQRSPLTDLPIDQASLLRQYGLADDDPIHIDRRRRPENRLGFALQLCTLHYPGHMPAPGETIPIAVPASIGARPGLTADALARYAVRRQTRQQPKGGPTLVGARPPFRTYLAARLGTHPAHRE